VIDRMIQETSPPSGVNTARSIAGSSNRLNASFFWPGLTADIAFQASTQSRSAGCRSEQPFDKSGKVFEP
jgi:hypothetical protein